MKKIATSVIQTQKIAINLAREIFPPKADQPRAGKTKLVKKAVVVGLVGELGSGKTVFAKGFAKGLGIKEIITSPTFVLLKKFKIKNLKFKNFVHIDAYRVEKVKELLDLGFKGLISDPKNVILIEWADRVKSILPKNYIQIKFKHIDKNRRKIWIIRKTR